MSFNENTFEDVVEYCNPVDQFSRLNLHLNCIKFKDSGAYGLRFYVRSEKEGMIIILDKKPALVLLAGLEHILYQKPEFGQLCKELRSAIKRIEKERD